ncbi:MAG: porin [Hyphomicrobiales bacterium]|nr:porin [Hyphomicrobiales bacterium]
MKLGKSLLLGSAAGFIAVTGAQAADLPTRKAAPVDYVRICSVYGPGFFYIPGTDTCLKIGGKAELDLEWDEPRAHADPSYGTNALGRVNLDARTATDWGLLRTFVQIDIRRRTGAWYGSGTSMRQGFGVGYGGGVNPNGGFPSYGGVNSYSATGGIQLESSVNVDKAFIQWGGLTAGRFQSFFDFYADNDNYHGMGGSDVTSEGVAYTYTFGNGFSATLAVEDGIERRNVVASTGTVAAGNIFPSVFTGAAFNNYAITFPAAINPIFASTVAFPGAFGSFQTGQRQNAPDVVGALRVDQGWGSAQLSGIWHRVDMQGSFVNSTVVGAGGSGAGSVAGGFLGKNQNGWAVQGGVKVNVPYFAPGDDFWVQGAYAKGCSTCTNSGYPGQGSGGAFNYGASTLEGYDGVILPDGHLHLTTSWSVLADFLHYWTPTIRQAVFGSYWRENFGNQVRSAAGFALGAGCPTCVGTITTASGANFNPFSPFYVDGAQWQVGSNLTWSPVKNLDIGVEVIYVRNSDKHDHFDANRGYPFIAKEDSQWLSRLKISRAF